MMSVVSQRFYDRFIPLATMQIILPVLEIIYIQTTLNTLQINAAITHKNARFLWTFLV